jgi:hypothetical protein
MKWHTRLVGFLLTCAVLIGLNVIATISGVYEFRHGDGDEQTTLTGNEQDSGIAKLAAI